MPDTSYPLEQNWLNEENLLVDPDLLGMKREELKELSIDELKSRLIDVQQELEELKFQKALQQLENPLQLRYLRKEIAQIKTVLNEFELGIRQAEA